MNTPLSADTPPHELLEATGQVAPPVRIAPLIEALGCRWKWTSDFKWPRVDASEPDTILVPVRANNPLALVVRPPSPRAAPARGRAADALDLDAGEAGRKEDDDERVRR